MAFADLAVGAKVYIWSYNAWGLVPGVRANVGHAALQIKTAADDEYLSWWPKGGEGSALPKASDQPVGYGTSAVKRRAEQGRPLQVNNVMETDKDREGESADHKFRFVAGLDFAKMIAWVRDLSVGRVTCSAFARAQSYNFTVQNCSATVAHCLREGGADAYTPWPGRLVWTPADVLVYCNDLSAAILRAHPMGAAKYR